MIFEQHLARSSKIEQDRARSSKIKQDQARSSKIKQDRAGSGKIFQDEFKQVRTRLSKSLQDDFYARSSKIKQYLRRFTGTIFDFGMIKYFLEMY